MSENDLDFIRDLTRLLLDYKCDVIKQVEDMLWEQYKTYDNLLDNGLSVYLLSLGSPRSDRIYELRRKLRVKMIGLLRSMSLIRKMRIGCER